MGFRKPACLTCRGASHLIIAPPDPLNKGKNIFFSAFLRSLKLTLQEYIKKETSTIPPPHTKKQLKTTHKKAT